MILDLTDKLIDYCLKLIHYKKDKDIKRFNASIKRIYQIFEEVHSSNIQSISEYIEIISKSDSELNEKHRIFQKIAADSLISSTQRHKLSTLADLCNEDVYGRFIGTIYGYLWWNEFSLFNPLFENQIISEHRKEGWKSTTIIDGKIEISRHDYETNSDQFAIELYRQWIRFRKDLVSVLETTPEMKNNLRNELQKIL